MDRVPRDAVPGEQRVTSLAPSWSMVRRQCTKLVAETTRANFLAQLLKGCFTWI